MGPEIFKYVLLIGFIAMTFWLSWVGMQKAKSIKGFAIGNKDMSPILVGITMASSTASTATFLINPGFVYRHGLSAYVHFGIAATLGMITALVLLTKKFRASGDSMGSMTIPGWIYDRYQNRGMSLFFALSNLLTISFVVLILAGTSILLASQFPISEKTALVCCLLFVFSYVLMGGVYAHAYTNAFQGIMMFFIALFLFFYGLKYFEGGFFTSLQSIGENFAKPFNPDSNLYYSFFSGFLTGFLITFALMLQPHILTKVLYLKDDKQVRTFLITAFVVFAGYTLMLFVGFYAKLAGLIEPRQDMIVTQYIHMEFHSGTFGPYIMAFITITLLAAGLSTLDGILVALSAMAVNDIYHPFAKRDEDPEVYQKRGLMLSRIVLVGIGLIALSLAWNPPELLGIFAQRGVYALAAASLVPIFFGVLGPRYVPVYSVFACAVIGLVAHLYLSIWGGVANPAVAASYAMMMSVAFYVLSLLYVRLFTKSAIAAES